VAPWPRVQIAIGCHFTFDVPTETHAVVLVEPHIDEEPRVIAPRFSVEPEVGLSSYLDRFANRCRRMTLPPGEVNLRFDATVDDDGRIDVIDHDAPELAPGDLPDEALQYLLPSRYCQSDEVAPFAFEQFGNVAPGWQRVQVVSTWVHERIGFDYGLASPTFTAVDVLRDGHGVCRDFAHLAIALCRALNVPARYVFGYLPDIGVPDPGSPMDFCAWMEVWLGDRWYTFDPRNDQHRIGRTVIGRGRDAADVAMVTTFGAVGLRSMVVIAEEV
jgi:transglutaminase-like putative cysteine protease